MESNKLIWNLAQQARREPAVLQQLQDHEPRAALAALRKLSEAHDFLKQLDNLLQICGHREQHLDICYPTWGEDPAPVIGFVRSYLKPGYTADPLRRESELIACREQETARVLEALSASLLDRLLRRPLFNCLLEQTQWLLRERDTMHFEWTRLFPAVRRMEFEIGSRLQQRNILDRAEDIFFLRLEEQEHLIDFPRPCQELVRRRRQAYEANLCGPWALLIRDGAAPGLEEGSGEQNLDSGILTGIGGSAGFAAGPVCVISGPETFPKLQPGDILVAQATNPVCTPLFALAGGIVTEVGGMLSHGAIVAREYGIPAVMSVAGATDLLVDGQVVAVDGNTGKVILEWAQDLTPQNSAQIHTQVAD
jgi:pyruvate,water dikinase